MWLVALESIIQVLELRILELLKVIWKVFDCVKA